MGVHIYPGFALGTLSWSMLGNPHVQQCTWGISPPSGGDALTCADILYASWTQSWIASTLSNKYTLLPATAAFRPGPDEDPIVASFGGNVTGTQSIACYAANTSALVHKRTDFGGRRGRGRSYIPAGYLKETDVDETGTLIAGAVTTFQTNMATFRSKVIGFGGKLVLLHETQGVLPREITSFGVDSLVATQRRRMR